MAETTLTATDTTAEAPEHEVLLTETAAAKVASLLVQEGRDDMRLRVAVQPAAAPDWSISSTSMSGCSMAMRSVPSRPVAVRWTASRLSSTA